MGEISFVFYIDDAFDIRKDPGYQIKSKVNASTSSASRQKAKTFPLLEGGLYPLVFGHYHHFHVLVGRGAIR
jgi:hypothetical protein